MLRLRALAALLILLCALTMHQATAQTPATGLYNFGSFDNRGFDSINIGNLNIHFEIPLASKPGRRLNFQYRMVYDGLFWTPSGVSGSQNWVPGDGFGFRGQLSGSLYAGYLTNSTLVGPGCYIGSRYVRGTTITNWVYHDPYGKNHRFKYSDSFDVCGDPDVYTGDGSTNDGSGYFLGPDAANGNIDGYVHGRDGLILNVPLNPTAPSSSSITDTNGNTINNNGNGAFTDTLGTTALTIGGNGTASSPRTFTYNVAAQADSTTTATSTMSYVTYTVQTNFGCSGVSEYGPMSVDLPDRLTLADGTYYQFSYESTPSVSGAVTGRLASVTLPTGGTISYQYQYGCGNGLNADGTTGSLNRVTSDGTRTYGRSPSTNGSVTTLQDEGTNQTLYTFTNTGGVFYETHRQAYQGTAGGTPLLDQQTCYNGATPSCDGAAFTLPITQTQVVASQNGGSQSKKVDTYASNGFLTGEQLYDYSGALLQTTGYSYVAPGRVSNVTVQDGSSHTLSQITYGYDEQTPTATSNIPQHTAASSPQGNQTSASYWLNAPSSTVQVKYTYDDTGQVTSMQDGRGNTTTYTYDSATNGFLSNTAYPTASLTTSAQYDAASGVLLNTTDANSQVTTYKYYDRLLRPAEVDSPDGGKTLYSYSSATERSVSVLQQGSTYINSIYDTDGYGRQSQVTQHDPVGGDSYINYTYYANGLVHTVTNPHRSSGSSTDGTTTYAYDAMGRTIGVTLPDSTNPQLSLTYSGNTVTKQDASGGQWTYTMDALGRLTKVIEPNTAETDYSYNIFTTTVTQKGVSGETPRPARTFTTDSLGRTVSVVEPESGTTAYVYDNSGNLSTKTDARGITTTYNYDALNRVTSITHSDGVTPNNSYNYDVAPGWMSDLQNIKGRLTNTANQYGGGTSGHATATTYSYDAMGRIIRTWEQTPSASPGGVFVYSKYDLAGDLTDLTYPDGRHVTQSWDGAGHLNNVVFADWNGQAVNYSYLSSPAYFPNGSMHSFTLGNGTTQTFNMNNRLQPTETLVQMSATWSNQTVLDKLYCYGAATPGCANYNVPNSGNIMGINDPLNTGRYQGFLYDGLNRLTGFGTGDQSISQTYTYDSFGNMSQVAPGTLQNNLSFGSNNQINSTGYGYDQSGNVTQSTNGVSNTTFAYDAESRLSSINNGAANYIYNETGQRARKNFSGGWTEYFFFGGQPIAELQPDGTWSDYIYANGQRIAQADSYDARIHFTGTNCSNCGGQYSMYYIPVPAITIQSGDKVAWRQYQTGSAVPRGGLAISFPDGNTNWVTTDQSGQVMNDLTTQNSWAYRVADLSQYTGKTINAAWINADANTGAGDWHEYFADIALYRQDGTVIPVYHRQTNISYPAASTSGVSNQTFNMERSNTSVDAMYAAATTTYYIGDQIGSARMLLAGTGWPVSSSTFYPFGQEAQNSTDPNHYKFTGLERDEQNGEAGLDHAMFRQYSSAAGRWMSPDPYTGSYDPTNPQSLNRYVYAMNNPLRFIDPLGLDYCDGANADDAVQCAQAGGTWVVQDPTSTDPNNCMTSTSNCTVQVTDPYGNGTAVGSTDDAGDSSGDDGGGGGGSATNNTPCVQPNLAQRLAVKVLGAVASFTNWTVGYGVGGSVSAGGIGPFGFNFGASQQLLVSPDGSAGLATTYTKQLFSVASKGFGGVAGLQLTGSSASTFSDTSGLSLDIGASLAGGGYGLGVDHSFSGGNYTGTFTLGGGFGGQGHAGTFTYTVSTPFCPS